MFGPDPIDLFDPSPYLAISYYGHLVFGSICIGAAIPAFVLRKGRRAHRIAGYVFIATLIVVSASSIEMLANVFIPPLFMAVFTALYAAGGAWLALQKGTRRVRTAEAGLFVFEIAGVVIFLTVAVPVVLAGNIPAFGPLVIAAIPLILLAGDVHWFIRQSDRARLRIARHMNRMIWAFVVVLRAPLVELAAGGLPIAPPVVIVGPFVLGVAMLVYLRRRHAPLLPASRLPASRAA